MNALLNHLSPENSLEIAKLHPHPFGEVTRILYKTLYVAVSREADTLRITPERIEAFRNGVAVGFNDIALLESQATITLREKLHQILARDKIVAAHMQIVEETGNELVCKIDNSSTSNSS